MTATTKCFSLITGGKVDREKGIISGVSVITKGDAKGHGIGIDQKTLQTVLDCANEFSSGVKVKFRHGKTGEYQSIVDEISGTLKNFSISGNKVRADFHLFKSLSEEVKNKIFEMAETIPDQFGLSIVFSGDNEELENVKFARCRDLLSVDLTDNPAANPDGLFESKPMKKEIKYESGDKGKHAKDCECADCCKSMSSQELLDAFQTLSKTVSSLVEKINTTPEISALSYKNEKGEVVQLSAEQIVAVLSDVGNIKQKAFEGEKGNIIEKLMIEGRVIFKDDGIGAKLEDLQKMDLPLLKFAARNAQVLPLVAKATYSGTGKVPDEKQFTKIDRNGKTVNLEGTELVTKAWSEKYGDLNKMIQEQTR